MLDTPFSTYQRSRGTARVRLGAEGEVRGLYQSGSAKALIPRTHGSQPEVVFLNTSGGLTGGDRLDFALDVAGGGTAMASTQTAERAYASPGGTPARVQVELRIGEGSTLYWLPQETILFEHASLDRVTDVHLADGARFVGIETIVLGRAHMGETLGTLAFTDKRRIWDLALRPIHSEHIAIDSGVLAHRNRPATLAGGTVFCTLTYIASDAEDRIAAVRAAIAGAGNRLAASAWDNRLVLRAIGDDAWRTRAAILPALRLLTGGAIPRVWQL